jgi:c-di-GMP-binding flagellar brake protein YcgR
MADLWAAPCEGEGGALLPLPRMEVLDLSVGGARLLHEGEHRCAVEDGQRLRLSLPLEADSLPLTMDALAVRTARVAKSTTHVGIEFSGLGETPTGRAMADKLRRYVADREREELRRIRGAD